jgi:hypothetical protein
MLFATGPNGVAMAIQLSAKFRAGNLLLVPSEFRIPRNYKSWFSAS